MTNRLPDPTPFDLSGVYETINDLPNPEQWHAKLSTHPGAEWNIKTIIPNHSIAETNVVRICDLWMMLHQLHPELVTITDKAVDWHGNLINGWQTIWTKDGWDIRIKHKGNGLPTYEIVPFQESSKLIAKDVLDMIPEQLAQSNESDRQGLEILTEICDTIVSQVSELDSQMMRKNLKVIDE